MLYYITLWHDESYCIVLHFTGEEYDDMMDGLNDGLPVFDTMPTGIIIPYPVTLPLLLLYSYSTLIFFNLLSLFSFFLSFLSLIPFFLSLTFILLSLPLFFIFQFISFIYFFSLFSFPPYFHNFLSYLHLSLYFLTFFPPSPFSSFPFLSSSSFS